MKGICKSIWLTFSIAGACRIFLDLDRSRDDLNRNILQVKLQNETQWYNKINSTQYLIYVDILYNIDSIYLNYACSEASNVSLCVTDALSRKMSYILCRENSTKKIEWFLKKALMEGFPEQTVCANSVHICPYEGRTATGRNAPAGDFWYILHHPGDL